MAIPEGANREQMADTGVGIKSDPEPDPKASKLGSGHRTDSGSGPDPQKSVPESVLTHKVDPQKGQPKAKVVKLADRKDKRPESVLTQGKKKNQKVSPADRPKLIPGHEWRRQGTGWTLLRYWYERDPQGRRNKHREYVRHYSGSALKEAESLEAAL